MGYTYIKKSEIQNLLGTMYIIWHPRQTKKSTTPHKDHGSNDCTYKAPQTLKREFSSLSGIAEELSMMWTHVEENGVFASDAEECLAGEMRGGNFKCRGRLQSLT